MGQEVECPLCKNKFLIHGKYGKGIMPGDEIRQCFNCGNLVSTVPNLTGVTRKLKDE